MEITSQILHLFNLGVNTTPSQITTTESKEASPTKLAKTDDNGKTITVIVIPVAVAVFVLIVMAIIFVIWFKRRSTSKLTFNWKYLSDHDYTGLLKLNGTITIY